MTVLRQHIMDQGLDAALFADLREEAGKACADLLTESPPFLAIPDRRADLEDAGAVLNSLLDGAARLVVLGTGGSGLGARGLISAIHAPPERTAVPVHVTDSLDADALSALLAADALPQTRFLVVSRSGETTETLLQTLTAMEAVTASGGHRQLAAQFAVITDAAPGPLRTLATDAGMAVLEHDPVVGRFAVLANVGLMPAMAAGIDALAVRAGARAALAAPQNAIDGAAFMAATARSGRAMTVLAAYAGRLTDFIHWSRMLIAESLGKEGAGLTPLAALGPGDQHSQLQLWLDGPPDKSFTFLDTPAAGSGPQVGEPPPSFAWLGGRSVGDLVDVQRDATIHALAGRGCPIRRISLPPVSALDEAAIGGLAMQFMLETAITARLFGVDPFTQPALAAGKRHVLETLGAPRP